MSHASEFFTKYLKVDDVPPKGIIATITTSYARPVYDKQQGKEVAKWHLELTEFPGLLWIPGNRQGVQLWDVLGPDPAAWTGQRILMDVEKLQNGVYSIRVRPVPTVGPALSIPAAQPAPKAKPQAAGGAATPPQEPPAPPDDLERVPPAEGDEEEAVF